MNNKDLYIQTCRVLSEYWSLKAEGKPIPKMQCRPKSGVPIWYDPQREYCVDGKNNYYRWKPETVKHKGGEYPKPCQSIEEVRNAKEIWIAYVDWLDGVKATKRYPHEHTDEHILMFFKTGRCHLTQEEAEQHSRVMLGLGGSDE